jgi:transposase
MEHNVNIFQFSRTIKVELLITIRGITQLVSLAFLSDLGDINRFSSTLKMNAYFGLVPQCSDSGNFA